MGLDVNAIKKTEEDGLTTEHQRLHRFLMFGAIGAILLSAFFEKRGILLMAYMGICSAIAARSYKQVGKSNEFRVLVFGVVFFSTIVLLLIAQILKN